MKKAYRIKKSAEIETIVKNKSSVSDGFFVLYTQKNHDNEHFRFAQSVSKKYGTAVERNLLKRRVREVVKDIPFVDDVDFFIVAKIKAKTMTFSEIKEALVKLFTRSKIIKGQVK